MKILFVGQPDFSQRIQELSVRLTGAGHEVTVVGTDTTLPGGVQNFQGVRLMRLPWAWLSFSLICLRRPVAVHVTGWSLAHMLPILRWLLPETILVWTIENLPDKREGWLRFMARQAARVCDAVTCVERLTQWQLLNRTGVRATYIPDGFNPNQSPLPSIRQWGLWRGRYTAAVARTSEEVAWVKRAYAKVKTRKKLVIVDQVSGGRLEHALLLGAAAIVIASPETPCATVLSAMESGRPIVAVTAPLLEEILGVTATFIAPRAENELVRALGSLKTTPKARRRARAHFTWERIFMEYLPLYHQLRVLVPLDSAHSVKFTEVVVN